MNNGSAISTFTNQRVDEKSKRHPSKALRSWSPTKHVLNSTILVLLELKATVLLAATSYVTPEGSAAPEINDPVRPWQLVEAAALALPQGGGTVAIDPGMYRENFSFALPVTLTAPAGGVVIGDLTTSIAETTMFSVLTWNTHLFGDNILLPTWLDYERAFQMGAYLRFRYEDIDVVSLCEVWDEDLFIGGDGAGGIRPQSRYPNWMVFDEVKGGLASCGLLPVPRDLHSGLALMTKHPMTDLHRVHFDACDGGCPGLGESPDCLASKGFLATTVTKDGFPIRIYNTHTQAGNGEDAVVARQLQLLQLAEDISAYRVAHPSHAALAMGDINVIGENNDQYEFMRNLFEALGGRDAARNAANVSMYNNHRVADTLTSDNELALYFDDTSYNQRLDYVWYFPSLDGHIRIQPKLVDSPRVRGIRLSDDDLTSDELSDHYPVEARFLLHRLE